jgi:hypothetical protein
MLSSPRKSEKIAKCAVLTKSSLKETKRGKMFSMTLCDQNTTSTIRAVCFQDVMFDKFEVTRTYDLKSFKIKKGMGSGNDVEMLITEETEVAESLIRFNIEIMWFKLSQIVRQHTQNIRFLNLKAKITSIEDLLTVGKYPDHKQKRDVHLADDTGQITLVLWRERAKTIHFKEGDVITIENAVT